MAVDYGRRHVGIALSDPSRTIASPLRTVDVRSTEQGVRVTAELAAAHGVTAIIVGLPRSLSGEEGPMAEEVRAWGMRVSRASGIPVHFVDERFTSREAEQIGRLRRRGSRADDIAAALVLRAFLDGGG